MADFIGKVHRDRDNNMPQYVPYGRSGGGGWFIFFEKICFYFSGCSGERYQHTQAPPNMQINAKTAGLGKERKVA